MMYVSAVLAALRRCSPQVDAMRADLWVATNLRLLAACSTRVAFFAPAAIAEVPDLFCSPTVVPGLTDSALSSPSFAQHALA